ncbi:hypothetical protein IWW45_007549 [Coemansia sp. RSA 485]|nr:hypothetical protein IWW45_007549 [Coemansia sp. RSA 485]
MKRDKVANALTDAQGELASADAETQSRVTSDPAEMQIEEIGALAKHRKRTRSKRTKKTGALKKPLLLSIETPSNKANVTANNMGEQTGGPAVVRAEKADPAFVAKCKEVNAIEAQSEVTSTAPGGSVEESSTSPQTLVEKGSSALQTLVEENSTCAEEAQAPSAMHWKRTRSKRIGKTGSFTKYRLVPVAP